MAKATSLRLVRTLDDGVQTTGTLYAMTKKGSALMGWVTIERPWLNNTFRKSCIPPGRYKVVHRSSKKFKRHLHIIDVKGRSAILIHAANDWKDIVGCVGPGRSYAHASGDSRIDVIHSKVSLNELLLLVPKQGLPLDVYAPADNATQPQDDVEIPGESASRLLLGSSGSEVKAVQRALRDVGHYKGNIDGDFGPLTNQAVRDFQAKAGLEVDGVVGPNTLDALGIERFP